MDDDEHNYLINESINEYLEYIAFNDPNIVSSSSSNTLSSSIPLLPKEQIVQPPSDNINLNDTNFEDILNCELVEDYVATNLNSSMFNNMSIIKRTATPSSEIPPAKRLATSSNIYFEAPTSLMTLQHVHQSPIICAPSLLLPLPGPFVEHNIKLLRLDDNLYNNPNDQTNLKHECSALDDMLNGNLRKNLNSEKMNLQDFDINLDNNPHNYDGNNVDNNYDMNWDDMMNLINSFEANDNPKNGDNNLDNNPNNNTIVDEESCTIMNCEDTNGNWESLVDLLNSIEDDDIVHNNPNNNNIADENLCTKMNCENPNGNWESMVDLLNSVEDDDIFDNNPNYNNNPEDIDENWVPMMDLLNSDEDNGNPKNGHDNNPIHNNPKNNLGIEMNWKDTTNVINISDNDNLSNNSNYNNNLNNNLRDINTFLDKNKKIVENVEDSKKSRKQSYAKLNQSALNKMDGRKLLGVLATRSYWKARTKKNDICNEYVKIGNYQTKEIAAKARDLISLKYDGNRTDLNFPISNYSKDLIEMKTMNDEDYLWSLQRQSVNFCLGTTGFYNVAYKRSTNSYQARMRYKLDKNSPKIDVTIGVFKTPEIAAIFVDLYNLHVNWKDRHNIVTNFRRGFYTDKVIKDFEELWLKKEHHQISQWPLMKIILSEPLPTSLQVDVASSSKELKKDLIETNKIASNIEFHNLNFTTRKTWPKIFLQDIAKSFKQIDLDKYDEKWKSLKNSIDSNNMTFEKMVIDKHKIENWLPSMASTFIKEKTTENTIQYDFYFPCIFATISIPGIGLQRVIFGLNFNQFQYSNNVSWTNLPNMINLPLEFNGIIASNGGLLVVEGDTQLPIQTKETNLMYDLLAWYNHQGQQNESIRSSQQSLIVVTNPLTFDIRLLPPIENEVLYQKVAQLNFYDTSKTTYGLTLVGGFSSNSTQKNYLALRIYCSRLNSWWHCDNIIDASPPDIKLGRSSVVCHGHSIYYGGVQIIPNKLLQKPVIFYFNIKKQQHCIFDFSTGGSKNFVKHVEPPKLVSGGCGLKLYAVTRDKQFQNLPGNLFVLEVEINKEGIPTGVYKYLENSTMPQEMYSLLFGKLSSKIKISQMYPKKSRPWETTSCVNFIGIKAIGIDPIIILYNVKEKKWILNNFPYNKSFMQFHNNESWKFIEGAYVPRWEVTA